MCAQIVRAMHVPRLALCVPLSACIAACNPWIVLVPAAGLYLTALLLTPSSLGSPYYVNGTLLLMQLALVGTSRLIATNLVTLKSETHFLVQLGSAMGLGPDEREQQEDDAASHPRFRMGGGVLHSTPAGGLGQLPSHPHLASHSSMAMGPSLASGQAVGATGLPLPPLYSQAGQHTTPADVEAAGVSSASLSSGGGQRPASYDAKRAAAAAGTLGEDGLDAKPHSPTMPMRGGWAHTPAHLHHRSSSVSSRRSTGGGGAAAAAPPTEGFRRYRLGARLARYGSSAVDLDAPAIHSYDVTGASSRGAARLLQAQGAASAPPPPPQRSPNPPSLPPTGLAQAQGGARASAWQNSKRVSWRGAAPPSTPSSLGAALAHTPPHGSDSSSDSASSGDDASPVLGAGGIPPQQPRAHSAPLSPRKPGSQGALTFVRSLRLAPQGPAAQAHSQRQLEFYRSAGARGRSAGALRVTR